MENEYSLKTGEKIIIREARINDAAAIMEHTLKVIRESQFMLTTPAEFALSEAQEKQWIKEHLEQPGWLLLVAVEYGRIIGVLSFKNSLRKRLSHQGLFGISIRKQMRNKGLGNLMITELIKWAKASPIIEKLSLEVFANNKGAIHLYHKLGFREEGRRIKQIKLSDTEYIDEMLMYLDVTGS